MAISGFLFISWRLLEIITLIPTLGMLAYFVRGYVSSNVLTPDFILVLFITSVLAAAWAIATTIAYLKARHSALFVATVDLGFMACFIAGVYLLRGISNESCTDFRDGGFYLNLGPFGYLGSQTGSRWAVNVNKTCAMLKASFAFGIMNVIFFFITFCIGTTVTTATRTGTPESGVKLTSTDTSIDDPPAETTGGRTVHGGHTTVIAGNTTSKCRADAFMEFSSHTEGLDALLRTLERGVIAIL
ncbi:hypothetical protein H2201_008097 [Coniosporium apollinis]|uniref:MARVEL domain-containing protein n=2 Tax=Coniosporium TaxID=2810619 RepID=A0ABQ9NKI2_9PEZI|nr:hypothetical protein H2199_003825 [Cladosporium sp. JES 115]KAJ9657691.1 hypothetical protein H2201_008097 [Coniosporium apollinis]